MLEAAFAALKARLQIPVAPAPANSDFSRPTVTQTDKPNPIIEAFLAPSPGYEPLLMSALSSQFAVELRDTSPM